MSNLIATFRASLTKSRLYSEPEEGSFGAAFKYIAVLILVVAALETVVLSLALIPGISQAKQIALDAIDRYPADLSIAMAKGHLSTNRSEPILLKPSDVGIASYPFENLLVIDASSSLDLAAFSAHKTAVLATRDGAIMADKNGGYRLQSFNDMPDFTIDKAFLEAKRPLIAGIFGAFSLVWIPIALALFLAGVYAISLIGALLFSLVGIIAALIVTRMRGHRLDFSQLYALSLYAYTIVVALGVVRIVLPILPSWIGILAFIAILIACVGRKEERKEETR